MNRIIKDTLIMAKKVFWNLRLEHERGEFDLKQWKQHVDFAERECQKAIDELDKAEKEEG